MDVKAGFFQNQLSWDGIIAIIAIVVMLAGFLIPVVWHWWRKRHPIKAFYSIDPYDFNPLRWKRNVSQTRVLAMGNNEVLIGVIPHIELNLRNIRVKMVKPQWFKGWPLKRWVSAESCFVRFDDRGHDPMVDMFHANTISPLYYFESEVDVDGSVLGWFFDDHDKSKGINIPAGGRLWFGLFVTGRQPWKGKLEIEISAAGRRSFERKPLKVSASPWEIAKPFHLDNTDGQ